MARPKKKKETNEKAENDLRRLTRSMSLKLRDLPAVPMDKILDALRISRSFSALANLRKTSKHWKCTVDNFLARRPPPPIYSMMLGNGARRTGGYTVYIRLEEDILPLNQFAGLRKTGVKRSSWEGARATREYQLTIRVRDDRDPIIDQLASSLGNIQWMNVFRLAADTDMRPMYRLLSKTRVEHLDCTGRMHKIPHQFGSTVSSAQFIIDFVRNVNISHVEICDGDLDKFLHDLDAIVNSASLGDYAIRLRDSGFLLGLDPPFWQGFLAEKLLHGTVRVNGEELENTDKIDLSRLHTIFSIGWTNK